MSVSRIWAKALLALKLFGHKPKITDIADHKAFQQKGTIVKCRRCDGFGTEGDTHANCPQCGGRGIEKVTAKMIARAVRRKKAELEAAH